VLDDAGHSRRLASTRAASERDLGDFIGHLVDINEFSSVELL
jgi:hypothetical protein